MKKILPLLLIIILSASSCKKAEVVPARFTPKFTVAEARYTGDDFHIGYGTYYLTLEEWELDEAGNNVRLASELYLRLFSPYYKDTVFIASRTYNPGKADTPEGYTFTPTGDELEQSSYYKVYDQSGTHSIYDVNSGRVSVLTKASDYIFTISLDGINARIRGSFEGGIVFENEEVIPDPLFFTFNNSLGSYFGDFFGTRTANFMIGLYNGLYDEDSDEFIPPYELLVIDAFDTLADNPGTFTPSTGRYDFDESAYINGKEQTFGGKYSATSQLGSYYMSMDADKKATIVLITGGQMDINRSGDNLEILAGLNGKYLNSNKTDSLICSFNERIIFQNKEITPEENAGADRSAPTVEVSRSMPF